MRLGIFGGSFDPVHYGHLLLAECCRERLQLDQVWFLPAAVPPHKQDRELAPGEARAAMLELAIGGHPAFHVCRYELERGGVNYTVDTLSHFRKEHAQAELFFLLGADSLRDFPGWKDPTQLCEVATLAIVERGDARQSSEGDRLDLSALAGLLSPARIQAIRANQVPMPRIELSASEIRQRVAAGQSIRYRTPRAVEEYIKAQGLYRAS